LLGIQRFHVPGIGQHQEAAEDEDVAENVKDVEMRVAFQAKKRVD
jgi:hypothetical protein